MILYYTGTGNSAYTAKRIAGAVGVEALDLFERLRDNDTSPLESQKPWVIVTPTVMISAPETSEPRIRTASTRHKTLRAVFRFPVFIVFLQLICHTRRNLRMESILPKTPTTKPVIA